MLIRVCFLFSQWLETDFLKYLLDWEDSVSRRTDIEQQDKNKLMLSRETLEGVRITGKPALCTFTTYTLLTCYVTVSNTNLFLQ